MRQRNLNLSLLLAVAAALLVAGCGGGGSDKTANAENDQAQAQQQMAETSAEPAQPATESQPSCMNCGTVTAIEQHDKIRGETSKTAMAGAVIGAVAGVMLGSSQFSGDEETAAEIAGGLAGAAAGHEIAQRAFTDSYYVVHIDMMNGGSKAIRVPKVGSLSVGQEVRVVGGTIKPR